jgi:bifunctional non-homologous end joining protein LigD
MAKASAPASARTVRRAARPRVALAPMLPVIGADPTRVDDAFVLSEWRDGWRCLAVLDDRVRIRGRAGRDLTPLVSHVAEALAPCRPRPGTTTVLDVLLVAPAGGGDELAAEVSTARSLDVVDVLCSAGRDVTALDLGRRQAELRRATARARDGVRALPTWHGSVVAALEQARRGGRAGHAGILARRAASPYRPGIRSPDWLAFVETPLEEVLLCGIARSGALVLGMATTHGVAFAGVAWPTRDWSRLAARCREGPAPFPPPPMWPSLGEVAWARPDLWIAVAPDVRPSSGRGGPRWRFVRVQEDLAP